MIFRILTEEQRQEKIAAHQNGLLRAASLKRLDSRWRAKGVVGLPKIKLPPVEVGPVDRMMLMERNVS